MKFSEKLKLCVFIPAATENGFGGVYYNVFIGLISLLILKPVKLIFAFYLAKMQRLANVGKNCSYCCVIY